MFCSVKSTALYAEDDNFKLVMGVQTKNLCYVFKTFAIRGMMEVRGGF